jgi:hypothetical protein
MWPITPRKPSISATEFSDTCAFSLFHSVDNRLQQRSFYRQLSKLHVFITFKFRRSCYGLNLEDNTVKFSSISGLLIETFHTSKAKWVTQNFRPRAALCVNVCMLKGRDMDTCPIIRNFRNKRVVLVSWGGVKLSPLDTSATIWPILPAPDDGWWVWSSRWNEWQGKPKY